MLTGLLHWHGIHLVPGLFPPIGFSMLLPVTSETPSTIPTSLLVFVENIFTTLCEEQLLVFHLVFILFRSSKIYRRKKVKCGDEKSPVTKPHWLHRTCHTCSEFETEVKAKICMSRMEGGTQSGLKSELYIWGIEPLCLFNRSDWGLMWSDSKINLWWMS